MFWFWHKAIPDDDVVVVAGATVDAAGYYK